MNADWRNELSPRDQFLYVGLPVSLIIGIPVTIFCRWSAGLGGVVFGLFYTASLLSIFVVGPWMKGSATRGIVANLVMLLVLIGDFLWFNGAAALPVRLVRLALLYVVVVLIGFVIRAWCWTLGDEETFSVPDDGADLE